jgi:hypothetical protein
MFEDHPALITQVGHAEPVGVVCLLQDQRRMGRSGGEVRHHLGQRIGREGSPPAPLPPRAPQGGQQVMGRSQAEGAVPSVVGRSSDAPRAPPKRRRQHAEVGHFELATKIAHAR